MTEQDPEPRQYVGIRLRPASLTEVDRIAKRAKVSRSEVLRLAFGYGLKAAEAELQRRKP
jgi:metal-responsive CopG/Arc/MetJ family transcriptional regulator